MIAQSTDLHGQASTTPSVTQKSWVAHTEDASNQDPGAVTGILSRVVVMFGFALFCVDAASGAGPLTLVRDGSGKAIIIYPEKEALVGECVYTPGDLPKTPPVLANLLADYVKRVTGAGLPVYPESKAPATHTGIVIHCGNTAYAKAQVRVPESAAEGGFVIAFPDERNIVIRGKYQHGIEWGVDEFIERYLGVRWLFPGPLGEHVPVLATLTVPTTQVNDEPVYLGRSISFDNDREELTEWTRRCRLRRRIRHSHNIGVIFHPVKFLKSNPELYPVQNGVRAKPKGFVGWQPCFSASNIADTIAPHIAQWFRGMPQSQSISLAVNDNQGHCECGDCLALDGDRTNYCGERNRSTSYYLFCNKAAKLVCEKYLPQRKNLRFGVLAYSNVAEPPQGVDVDDRIVPFITLDRMIWLDPEERKHGHEINNMWSAVCPELGWYDYIYGKYYLVPRVYFHAMADYLRWGAINHVKYYYAEAYIDKDYKSGPKYYLTMRLLWNPNIDVDATLDEWYRCAVGPRAAVPVAEYFRYWEEVWTKRIPRGEWFNEHKGTTYLPYGKPGYCADIRKNDLDDSEELLMTALRLADKPVQKKRIQLWLTGLRNARAVVLWASNNAYLNKDVERLISVRTLMHETFDKDIGLWGHWKSSYSFANFAWDDTTGRTRPGAMFLDKTKDTHLASPTGTVFMKRIQIKPGQIIRATVWAKADGSKPGARWEWRVRWQDARDAWVRFMTLTDSCEPEIIRGKWQQLQLAFQVPDLPEVKSAMLTLGPHETNSGKFWFDDFTVEEVRLK